MADESYTIAHIGDLHLTERVDEDEKHVYSLRQLRAIERAFSDLDFDKLVVTGDLTHRGDGNKLAQARDWLFSDFAISGKKRLGLRLDPTRVEVLPGNHDAFHERPERAPTNPESCWRQSLAKYHSYFQEYESVHTYGCRYDWVRLGDGGIFLIYVDTSYLGDPYDSEIQDDFVSPLRRVQPKDRGGFYTSQSEQVLNWFSRGVNGDLPVKRGEAKSIPADAFARSLKVLAAHHYLFRGSDKRLDRILKNRHQTAAFGKALLE